MIVIIDYGAGNIFSVKNALDYIGINSIVSNAASDIINADKLILPGVGAFPNAMKMLKDENLLDIIVEEAHKKPFLGICLGMQMLFTRSFEFSETNGLDLIHGNVEKLTTTSLSIPHMGWNKLETLNNCEILQGIDEESYVYFVHSFKAKCCEDRISAYCNYGEIVPAVVFDKNIYGTQFHPEKSGSVGLKILKNFGGLT